MVHILKSQIFTIVFSWFIPLFFVLLGGNIYSPSFLLILLAYKWVPGLMAICFFRMERIKFSLWDGFHMSYISVSLLGISIVLLVTLFSLPFSEMRSLESLRTIVPSLLRDLKSLPMIFLFIVIAALIALIAGYTVYLLGCLGEEIMWRGYLWDKLKIFGFWRASLSIGFFWGLWLTPIVLMGWIYPDHNLIGILWIIIFSILATPLLVYLRIISNSVIVPAIFRGVMSAFSLVNVYLFYSANTLYVGISGVTGFITFLLVNLSLFLKIRNNPLLIQYD